MNETDANAALESLFSETDPKANRRAMLFLVLAVYVLFLIITLERARRDREARYLEARVTGLHKRVSHVEEAGRQAMQDEYRAGIVADVVEAINNQ